MSKPLTDEMLRIMRAIDREAMHANSSGRYVIAGEPRPDRRSRELLMKRGLIEWRWKGETRWYLTDKGRAALSGAAE